MVLIKSGNLFKNILWLQWVAGIGAMIMMFTLGLTIGWTSPYLVKLTSGNSELTITTEEASWVGSLLNLGRFIGAIVGGVSVQFLASKHTMIFIGFPLMIGWICTIFANSVTWLYVARIAVGLSMGMSYTSFPIFLGEVASPKLRGSLVTLTMSGVAFGSLIGNTMGAYMPMRSFAYISLVPNVTFILLFIWIPQSPHYLVRAGRMEDAEKSISRYDPYVNSKTELDSLKDFIAASSSKTFRDQLREFNIPRNRKAGLITLVLYFFMQFSGLNSVIFYQELIVTAAKVTIIPPTTLVIISNTAGVLSGLSLIYIADKFERKVLMIASSIVVGIAMVALGTHFELLNNDFDPDTLQWLPMISVILFISSVCTGLTVVPSIILSELLAPNVKTLAACFASISAGLLAFIAAATYLPLVGVIGEAYYFWGQAIVMVLCIIFSAIFIPQTRGKSLQEIQDALMRK